MSKLNLLNTDKITWHFLLIEANMQTTQRGVFLDLQKVDSLIYTREAVMLPYLSGMLMRVTFNLHYWQR